MIHDIFLNVVKSDLLIFLFLNLIVSKRIYSKLKTKWRIETLILLKRIIQNKYKSIHISGFIQQKSGTLSVFKQSKRTNVFYQNPHICDHDTFFFSYASNSLEVLYLYLFSVCILLVAGQIIYQ